MEAIARSPRLEATARKARNAYRGWYPIHKRRRQNFARQYYESPLDLIRSWSVLRTEEDNFYYSLTDANRQELACLVAVVTGGSPHVISGYITEVESDGELRHHIETFLHQDSALRDLRVAYGRRVGWYAFIRVLKPRLIIETGVHHGVGACVIATALARNAEEGQLGKYIGTDIDPLAGRLFTGAYSRFGEIRFGDSLKTLECIEEEVDIFINDSDHSRDYEAAEYREIAKKLAKRSLILGDNSHVSSALLDFSISHERAFLLFHEQPKDHWYPGAGIGVSPSNIPLCEEGSLR